MLLPTIGKGLIHVGENQMKVLVAVKRVVDYSVKVRVKSDNSGVDITKNDRPELAAAKTIVSGGRPWAVPRSLLKS
jgi:electron transfer flavoprotein alpha subunit